MQNRNSSPLTILALDVGERRIGVALARPDTRLPQPLVTLTHTATIFDDLNKLIAEHQIGTVVVGLPRGLDGQSTAQTRSVERFAKELRSHTQLPLYWQDEAVTSRQAEEELKRRKKPYAKGDIDALAAIYILEDFLRDHPQEKKL
jgi:putative pre-16S rRNA nuclease